MFWLYFSMFRKQKQSAGKVTSFRKERQTFNIKLSFLKNRAFQRNQTKYLLVNRLTLKKVNSFIKTKFGIIKFRILSL